MLELFHNDMSTCAQKVRITLFEKGLDWEGHALNLRRGDQFDPDYMKLNPNGVVPTLRHDGHVVIESNRIIEYLDETFPKPPLRPADDAGRKTMRDWFTALDERIHPVTGVLSIGVAFRHEYIAEGPEAIAKAVDSSPDETKRQAKRALIENGIGTPFFDFALKAVDDFLGEMDAALARTPWLAGDAYSLADIALTPYLGRFGFLGMEGFWSDRPHLADWLSRVKARPSFQRVLIDDVAPKRMDDLIRHGKDNIAELTRRRGRLAEA